MTLGNRITRMRTAQGMSQGDLAEKLGVSRQSVSKWETDASVPDIDNLIFLSNLFDVTLDELVKGESSADKPDAIQEYVESGNTSYTNMPEYEKTPEAPKPQISLTQKILGFIFLGTGLFTVVLGLAIGIGLIIFAPLLIIYGIICLTVRRHAGLVCAWATVIPCLVLMPYFTSCSLNAIFSAYYWAERSAYGVQLTVSAILWVILLSLSFFTAKATPIKNHPFIATGWVALFLLRGHVGYGILTPINFHGVFGGGSLQIAFQDPVYRANAIVQFVFGMGANLLLVLLIYLTYRAVKKHIR